MEGNNSEGTSQITEEEKARLKEQEMEKDEKHKALIKKYLKFLALDYCTEDTKFLDINYNNGEAGGGRTLIALGNFGLHARMLGNKTGKVHDPQLAIDREIDTEFDVILTRLRHEVTAIDLLKRKNDFSQHPAPESQEEIDARHEYSYELVIYFGNGSIRIPGLKKDIAFDYRKIIYAWMTNTQSFKPLM